MAKLRAVSTAIWSDDLILSMSPEQKLIFLYLHCCPAATQCGIFKLPVKTLGFHLGYTQSPVENAVRGLCAAFPDFVIWDEETGEIALPQYPRQTLITATGKVLSFAVNELKEVQSEKLLKAVIAANSATVGAMYLSRLRQIQMENVNKKKAESVSTVLHVELIEPIEEQRIIQESIKEKEIEKEKEIYTEKKEPEIEKIPPAERKVKEALLRAFKYFEQYPAQQEYMCINAGRKDAMHPEVWKATLEAWIRYNVDNPQIIQNIETGITKSFAAWLKRNLEASIKTKSNGYANANRNTETANERITRVAGGAIEFHNELLAKHGLLQKPG